MPDIEAIIEAILRARFKENYDTMSKVDLWAAKQDVLELLIPGIPAIEEIKARVWDEGVAAQDTYLRDTFLGTRPDEEPEKPRNPYRTGAA